MRRARWVVLAAVLLLAGCAGVPTAGRVQAGPPFGEQGQLDAEVLVEGPATGADQQAILAGFMQAVRSPRNRFEVARQFLTPALRETWQPGESTTVRTTWDAAPSDTVADRWTYAFSTRATVDADGRYTESPLTTTQTLEFDFQQVDGQWRISAAPNGIVLSQSSFDIAFRRQALYFFDSAARFLVPEVRWFPSRSSAPVTVVQELLEGPSDWLSQGVLQSAFPVATALDAGSVSVSGNTATVDLTVEALDSSDQDRDRMRQQLAATLGVPNVSVTVAGRPLPLPAPAGAAAVIDPQVDPAALVGDGTAFGFDGGTGITPLPGLGDAVIAAGATAATLGQGKQLVAYRGGDGAVASVSGAGVVVLDDRPGLTAPSLDPFDFVWSAPTGDVSAIVAFGAEAQPVQSSFAPDTDVIAMEVSRDGARLLLYLSGAGGPQLVVAGIVRENDVPVRLGQPFTLPVDASTPIDATWVDDRTVATLSGDGRITAFELGGPSTVLGTASGATTLVGGNNGTDGLRVLADGEVRRPQGGSGWVGTGIAASLLAVKQ